MNTDTARTLTLRAQRPPRTRRPPSLFVVFVIVLFCVAFVSEREPSAVVSGQAPPAPQTPTQAQQRPVFRGGTHFVRVDVYPVQDGKIVEGLTPADFEVFEDNKPQAIESFDFIKFDTFTPESERRRVSTQQEGFDLAADPRYRVFVIFVDLAFSTSLGAFTSSNDLDKIQTPLVGFLDRVLGPQDLFGLLTSRNSVKDLVLSQTTPVIRAQLLDLWRASQIDRDQADEIDRCDCGPNVTGDACRALLGEVKARHRADATYAALHDLVAQLGAIRQERKNIVFVTNSLTRARENPALVGVRGPSMPRAGILNGRPTTDNTDTRSGEASAGYCASEFQRVANIDFSMRYRDLLDDARKENVSFYVITPAGLQAPVTVAGMRAVDAANDDLRSLASETDGLAIVNTNDLSGGMKRIADDLSAYYVLGYYTTNTKFDGSLRNIKVRYKATGKQMRARRQYRAPTEAEIAALASAPAARAPGSASTPATVLPRDAALAILERAGRPFAAYVAAAGTSLTVVAELSAASIQAGRWKDGADVDVAAVGGSGESIASAKAHLEAGRYSVAVPLGLPDGAWPARITVALRSGTERPTDDWVKMDPPSGTLVGEAVVSRAASRVAPRPVAAFEFARNERMHAEWAVLTPLDRREIRLLDRTGKPLPVDLPLSEDPVKHALVLDMSLSGLPRGDYLIELTAGAGSTVDHRLLAIRIKP